MNVHDLMNIYKVVQSFDDRLQRVEVMLSSKIDICEANDINNHIMYEIDELHAAINDLRDKNNLK